MAVAMIGAPKVDPLAVALFEVRRTRRRFVPGANELEDDRGTQLIQRQRIACDR